MMTISRNSKRTGLSFLWITFVVIGLDQLSKMWVMQHLVLLQPLRILSIFNLTLAYNKGAAFGFMHSASGWQNNVLTAIAALVSLIILIWLARLPSREKGLNTALCLIIGGALGNVWDRVRFSYVIDFLDFHWASWHFAIFNVADSAICIGAVMLFWSWYKQK